MTISVSELASQLAEGKPLQLVDVRSPGEYAGGHIPGAMNIPLEEAEGRVGDLSAALPLVLICQGGTRAGICYERLGKRANMHVLEGGTQAWIAEDKPVVATARTRWSLERQVRLLAGLLAFTGAVLAWFVDPRWILLSGLIGLGLMLAGLTGLCPMARLLARMPWNHPIKTDGNSCPLPG